MTATAQPSARVAAQPAPGRAPDVAPRPPLRVVEPGERRPRPKVNVKQRRRLVVVSATALAAAVLFGLVAAHVLLTQNQFRLQSVQRQAAEEQARYERLRAEVAELESPARIASAAQERLGMVAPNSVKYLTPAGVTTPKPAAGTTAQAAEDDGVDAADSQEAVTDWSVVKRRLSSRP